MHFDDVYSWIKTREAEAMTKSILPESFLQRRFRQPKPGPTTILLPGWGMRLKTTDLYRRRFLDGDNCFQYGVPRGILSADIDATVRYFEQVRDEVCEDMRTHGGEYHIIGYSLGMANAMMIANDNDQVRKVTLITPTHSVAETIWHGVRTQHIRRNIERQGVTLDELSRRWSAIAPENQVAGLSRDIEIGAYISRSDRFIPYEHGMRLVERLHAAGHDPVVHDNRYLGHVGTLVKHLLFNS